MLTLYSIAATGTFEHDFKKLDKSIQKQVDNKDTMGGRTP